MPVTEANLDEIFKYHPPDELSLARYQEIREAAKQFARVILQHTPASADQSAAIRKLRECVMTANAAIALKGKY